MTSKVFDEIAPSWYNFRHHSIFSSELEGLAARWRQGRLLNIGCAHGPDFLPFQHGFELHGVDNSRGMLQYARKYASKYTIPVSLTWADAISLPYAGDSFDWAVAVAAYHHIKRDEARLAALSELRRILKPGGEAFITVWNRWQPRFWLQRREVVVPWRQRDKTLYRYYYLFTYREIETLARQVGFRVVRSAAEGRYHGPVKYFSRNICLLVTKER